jgi:hypothetical protein
MRTIDTAAERAAALARVAAREQPPEYIEIHLPKPPYRMRQLKPGWVQFPPAATLAEWADDKIIRCWPAHMPCAEVIYAVLLAARETDPSKGIAAAIGAARRLDVIQQHAAWRVIEIWKGDHPVFAGPFLTALSGQWRRAGLKTGGPTEKERAVAERAWRREHPDQARHLAAIRKIA